MTKPCVRTNSSAQLWPSFNRLQCSGPSSKPPHAMHHDRLSMASLSIVFARSIESGPQPHSPSLRQSVFRTACRESRLQAKHHPPGTVESYPWRGQIGAVVAQALTHPRTRTRLAFVAMTLSENLTRVEKGCEVNCGSVSSIPCGWRSTSWRFTGSLVCKARCQRVHLSTR
jgi:hypothetical protein